ncbi:MAG TPA: sigma-70 family RNA polymerase sigma factor, partial [Lacunisphaera sp.]|nr:sigma-70 family RNA polymerase sigma factor [Lacunisphaera sp.]
MPTDAELLRRYAGQKDERAFAGLVERHLGLVHATALRTTGGRRHVAEEIVQKVFADVARKSAALCHHPVLTGWLYRSTRYAAMEANRTEQRRQKLNQNYAAMSDPLTPAEPSADWEQLRPVIDGAMEELREGDRELLLLRFFQGLTFPDIATRLELSENAARMRTERALEKLRGHLDKRGVTSTGSALGLVLTNQALAVAPAGMTASVTSAALSAAPLGTVAALFTQILMNKTMTASLSAVLAAGVTSLTWASLPASPSETELAALRAENARLTAAGAPGASTAAVTGVVDESAARVTALVQAVDRKIAQRNARDSTDYRNHGMATPLDGARTMGWAVATGNMAALSKVLHCAANEQETNQMIFDRLPGEVRARYGTLEEVMAFCFIARSVIQPPPSADIWDKKITDTEMIQHGPERVEFHPRGQKTPGPMMVLTSDGWKWEL